MSIPSTVTPPSPAEIRAREYLATLKVDTLENSAWLAQSRQSHPLVEGKKFVLPYNTDAEKAFADAVYKIVTEACGAPFPTNQTIKMTRTDDVSIMVEGGGVAGEVKLEAKFLAQKSILRKIQREISGLEKNL